MPPQDGLSKVTAICWSANNKRLAVVTVDRIVRLYDEKAEQKDKFSTKPAEAKGPKNYVVSAMEFSPDSSKLAIAQSDNIVFVYKLGLEWGDKKSICNKFLQSSPITCMTWPISRPNEIVYGLAEGKVKVGQLRSNKPATLYSTDSYASPPSRRRSTAKASSARTSTAASTASSSTRRARASSTRRSSTTRACLTRLRGATRHRRRGQRPAGHLLPRRTPARSSGRSTTRAP